MDIYCDERRIINGAVKCDICSTISFVTTDMCLQQKHKKYKLCIKKSQKMCL
jgi:hypothetical protein